MSRRIGDAVSALLRAGSLIAFLGIALIVVATAPAHADTGAPESSPGSHANVPTHFAKKGRKATLGGLVRTPKAAANGAPALHRDHPALTGRNNSTALPAAARRDQTQPSTKVSASEIAAVQQNSQEPHRMLARVMPSVTTAPLAAVGERISAMKAEASLQRATVAGMRTGASVARPTTLTGLVGSAVMNVLGAALQVFSGRPALPPGSTVSVSTSTLTLETGQTVQANWYFPENADESTRLIYFQHGFMATGPMYSYTAATLAQETDSIVVTPTLSSNLFNPTGDWLGGAPEAQAVADLFAGNREALTESASAAAGHPVVLPTKFVLVGHSLGGMLVSAAAGDMVENGAIDDLEGVVLLDSVDFNGTIPDALDALSGPNYRPVYDISSVRYVWNVDGVVGDELSAARPGEFNGVMLVDGHHIDSMRGGNQILQVAEYLVAGFSEPQNVDAVPIIAAGWINDMFAHTETGLRGDPQQVIEIPTPAGTATAVVLPFTSDEVVQVTPWDGVAKAILDRLFLYAVWDAPQASTVQAV
jgi:hypothetical protein